MSGESAYEDPTRRTAVRAVEGFAGEPCCACGKLTASGIYLRANPAEMKCNAQGVVHE